MSDGKTTWFTVRTSTCKQLQVLLWLSRLQHSERQWLLREMGTALACGAPELLPSSSRNWAPHPYPWQVFHRLNRNELSQSGCTALHILLGWYHRDIIITVLLFCKIWKVLQKKGFAVTFSLRNEVYAQHSSPQAHASAYKQRCPCKMWDFSSQKFAKHIWLSPD